MNGVHIKYVRTSTISSKSINSQRNRCMVCVCVCVLHLRWMNEWMNERNKRSQWQKQQLSQNRCEIKSSGKQASLQSFIVCFLYFVLFLCLFLSFLWINVISWDKINWNKSSLQKKHTEIHTKNPTNQSSTCLENALNESMSKARRYSMDCNLSNCKVYLCGLLSQFI